MKAGLIIHGVISVFALIGILSFSLGFISLNSEKCSWSEYNVYTNMTGGLRFYNTCRVPTNRVVEFKQKCGFLGISCWETEPYLQNVEGSVCFKLNNGNLC